MPGRIPRIDIMTQVAGASARRFPWVLLAAVTAAISAIVLIEQDADTPALIHLLMTAQLGIPLLAAATLLSEQRVRIGLPAVVARLLPIAGVVLLGLFYLSLPVVLKNSHWFRFVQFNVAAHLLVAVAAFPVTGLTNAFWHFNREIFVRLLIGLVFTAVLFGGLALALAALDTLFGVEIKESLYAQLWVALVFVFNTWYWLGGVPRNVADLETSTVYPRALKVFAQWILTPLVAVYLVLLTAYLVKVVVTTQWPSGWIGWLVSGVGAAGLFSLLLLYPVFARQGSRWIRRYAFAFHLLVLPAVVMLLLAINQRVGQYGWTEKRYDLAVLALWLGVVAAWGLLRRQILVKVIPLSLLLVVLLAAFGPWGAFSVSRHSQLDRLDGLLTNNDLLQDGKLTAAPNEIAFAMRREITAKVTYLVETHGGHALGDRLPQMLATRLDSIAAAGRSDFGRNRAQVAAITQEMGFEPVTRWQQVEVREFEFRRDAGDAVFALDDYTHGLRLELPRDRHVAIQLDGQSYLLNFDQTPLRLTVTLATREVATVDLAALITSLEETARDHDTGRMPPAAMSATARGDGVDLYLVIERLNGRHTDDGLKLHRLEGVLLVRASVP